MKKILLLIIAGLILVAIVAGWNIYKRVLIPNVKLENKKPNYIYIPTGATFNTLLDTIASKGLLRNITSFEWLSERMNYTTAVKPGRFAINHGMNNMELITLLRSGEQAPVKLTFNNLRNLEQFAGRASKILEVDSAAIVATFRNDTLLRNNELNSRNSVSVLIPNTYEFYWNTNALQLYERMNKEFHRFWNKSRISKLQEANLTRQEVIVIASIVEQETRKDDEKPIVAGVYVNRYKQGWKLEADPTLIYALNDFTIRRVLNQHKEVDSPYNTYRHAGLPPGPICIPSIPSIDAVLNYVHHEYYYFCAKDDFSGYHAFATNYSDHLLNAKRFHRALTNRGIMN